MGDACEEYIKNIRTLTNMEMIVRKPLQSLHDFKTRTSRPPLQPLGASSSAGYNNNQAQGTGALVGHQDADTIKHLASTVGDFNFRSVTSDMSLHYYFESNFLREVARSNLYQLVLDRKPLISVTVNIHRSNSTVTVQRSGNSKQVFKKVSSIFLLVTDYLLADNYF